MDIACFIRFFYWNELYSLSTLGGIVWICATMDFLASTNAIKIGHFWGHGMRLCVYDYWL
jgi:hypothetical protein